MQLNRAVATQKVSKSGLEATCISKVTNGSDILNPCGLIANSFFTGECSDPLDRAQLFFKW